MTALVTAKHAQACSSPGCTSCEPPSQQHMQATCSRVAQGWCISDAEVTRLEAFRKGAQLGEAGSTVAVQLVRICIHRGRPSRQGLCVVLDSIWVSGLLKRLHWHAKL